MRLTRIPLANGLLTRKTSENPTFPDNDHKKYSRHGETFDVGETFAGVPFRTDLAAVDELHNLLPEGFTMAKFVLRWILMFDEVSPTIPGAKNPKQARQNAAAFELPALDQKTMMKIEGNYTHYIREEVHHRW